MIIIYLNDLKFMNQSMNLLENQNGNMIVIDLTRKNIGRKYLVTIKHSCNIMARMNDVFRSMLHLHIVLTMASSPESGYRLVLFFFFH
jgi:hypothetical protein